jgi:hypothetical protein
MPTVNANFRKRQELARTGRLTLTNKNAQGLSGAAAKALETSPYALSGMNRFPTDRARRIAKLEASVTPALGFYGAKGFSQQPAGASEAASSTPGFGDLRAKTRGVNRVPARGGPGFRRDDPTMKSTLLTGRIRRRKRSAAGTMLTGNDFGNPSGLLG